jgi:uncharacterized protein YdeI (YjbR/CyaY-like superfamily)
MPPLNELPITSAKGRQEWRRWLEENHATSQGVWLVFYKKGSGKPSVTYQEAVEEALAFGWIDSLVNAMDDLRYKQVFTPRKPRSSWSRLNKQRVEKLILSGAMTKAGLAKVEAAKQDGSWYSLDSVENLEFPEDLAFALANSQVAMSNFMASSPSVRKIAIRWINDAKRLQTREKRIREIVLKTKENKKSFES